MNEKQLLKLEIVLGAISTIAFLTIIIMTVLFIQDTLLITILSIIAGGLFIIGMSYCLKIEQMTGYYQCSHCKHKHVPTYSAVFWAMHIGRTRYLKCPECKKRSWNKKVLGGE